MTCLCLAATVLGYLLKPSVWLARKVSSPVMPSRILHVGILFVACGIIFGFLLSQIQIEINSERGGMTGRATLYLFFASLKFPGLAICLSLMMQKLTFPRLVLVFFAAISPFREVILGGRREPAVVLGLIVMLSLYFYRRKKPSAAFIFGALLMGMLAIPATGIYRGLAAQGELSQIRRLDLVGNFKDYFGKESILELRNAAAIIESTQIYEDYEYGAGYWNQMVFRFVPAQLVGKSTKDAILVGNTVEELFRKDSASGHEYSTGSTLTGIGDSFKQFGWFGCIFFAVLAVVFKSFWLAAIQPNALFAQLLYLLICTSAMRAVTHQTVDFLPGFSYQFMFLCLGLWYARDKNAQQALQYGGVPATRFSNRGSRGMPSRGNRH